MMFRCHVFFFKQNTAYEMRIIDWSSDVCSSDLGQLHRAFPALDLILIESGGDNLAATFSPELADITIYVIDVSAGDKIPRKGGPGITRAELLVINKIDLEPFVGERLQVMAREAKQRPGQLPYAFANGRPDTQ